MEDNEHSNQSINKMESEGEKLRDIEVQSTRPNIHRFQEENKLNKGLNDDDNRREMKCL